MRAACAVFIATSFDGFIARVDGSIDWLSIVQRPGEDYGYQSFLDSVDTLVVGRKTYETALGFEAWPYAGKRCVVLTTGRPQARHGEEFDAGAPAPLVDRLTAEGARRIYVDGGGVIQAFLAAGLVGDLTVSMVPVLLGDGVRLFGSKAADVRLELIESRAFTSGLVQVRYRVGGSRP